MKYEILPLLVPLFLLMACQKGPQGVESGATLKVTTHECTEITDTSAFCSGEVTSEREVKVTVRGFCWSSSEEPKFSDNHCEAGKGLGEFSATINGIQPNNTYYVRAFASTSDGIVYGNQVTLEVGIFPPRVKTGMVTDITATSALCAGSLESSAGGTISGMGICWSTTENPSIEGSHKDSGKRDGEFEVVLDGLVAGTTYFVRAYATNEAGTAYGEQISFTADANPVITVKDKRLQAVLVELFDLNKDGVVKKDEAEQAKVLIASERNIYNIDGLENYLNLTEIQLNGNHLANADFRSFKDLKILNIADNNKLAQVNLSGCTKLEYYWGQHTAVTRLDFAGFSKLRELHAFEGWAVLEVLDLSGCSSLEHLEIRDTPNTFTSLSFKNLPSLRNLFIGGEVYEKVETLELDLPSLENINLNCWKGLKSLDLSKCPKIRSLSACQLYALTGGFDASLCPELDYLYIPDATSIESLTIANHRLKALDAWNLYKIRTCSIDADSLVTANLQTAGKMEALTLKAPRLRLLNINAAHELGQLDLSECPSLTNLQACQLYKIPSFDASCCPQLDTLYLPDALRMKSAKLNNPKLTRAELFGSPEGLETLEMNCPELKYLRLDACRKLKNLDLSTCVKLTRLEACQLYVVPSIDVSMCTKLNYLYIPDATAATLVTIGNSPDLEVVLCWNCGMETLNLSQCAKTILELNAGLDGAGGCPNLKTIYLRREQTIKVCTKPESAEFKYVD